MRSKRQGIAIVGMSCRLPGLAHSPSQFWELLDEGTDAVTRIGAERWASEHYYHCNPKAAGKSYTFAAGVLDDIERFDAEFFGVSPREAAQMDPQQRLLLEMAWEAFEDAGQLPRALAGSSTGVYVGISSTDYANRRLDDPSSGDAYFMTGGTLSIAANRLSYQFDLHGPSMAIDTACSSSMVAVHQACQSLWAGESDAALVGGVNMLLTPFPFIGFSKASMLSPLGQCRAFDAQGQGYVRAEGGAMLYLKPLARAKADGDPIHAVILASGCNSDGRTKGLSMPSAQSQEALLRQVYEEAGVDAADVAYLEAHGTGTGVGDPVEAGAIGRALGQQRNGRGPLPIGSVKSNIGHLEPASGVAGLLKTVLSLEHGVVPPSLHFDNPNPDIDFEDLNLEVVDKTMLLPPGDRAPVMGVNSFGFGGTNAHVIVQAHRGRRRRTAAKRGGRLPPLVLSARSPGALGELASEYARMLALPGAPAYDIAYSAATRRQHHPHRLAVTGRSAADVAASLESYAAKGKGAGVTAGQVFDGRSDSKVAFLFSGNGSQWAGMGRSLLATSAEFRGRVEEVDTLMRGFGAASVLESLQSEDAPIERTEIAQPALFALQVALFDMLVANGLVPDAVYGHSVGEVAAAYAAGLFDLESAARIIFERSAAQALTHGMGKMAAMRLGADEAQAAIASCVSASNGAVQPGDIEVAAMNSPSSVTLSGKAAALAVMAEQFGAKQYHFNLLDLEYAFHSQAMESVSDGLLAALEGLTPAPRDPGAPPIEFISTVTGQAAGRDDVGAQYWWRNVRRPVQLEAATSTLIERGCSIFVEIGPNPIMQAYLRDSLRSKNASGRPVASLRKNAADSQRITQVIADAYVLGAPVDMSRLFRVRGVAVPLPAYPWQRERHWYEGTSDSAGLLERRCEHPLLGWRTAPDAREWENHIDVDSLPYLAHHVVGGVPVFPAAGFIEMAMAASHLEREAATHSIEELEIRSPLLLDRGSIRAVRFKFTADDGSFAIRSRLRLSEDPWTVNVVGRVAGPVASAPHPALDLGAAMRRATPLAGPEQHYALTARAGLEYGPCFQTVTELRRAGNEVWAKLRQPEGESAVGYHLHPAVLDGALQALVALGLDNVDAKRPPGFLPFKTARIVERTCGGERVPVACRVRLVRTSPRSLVANFRVMNADGETLLELDQFRFRRMALGHGAADAAWYRFRAEAAPLLSKRRTGEESSPVPDPHVLGDLLVEELTEQWYLLDRAEHYATTVPLFDALTGAFAARAVSALAGSQESFSPESLAVSARVPAERLPLLRWLLVQLEQDGMAERDGGSWRLTVPPDLSGPEEIWRLLVADFPAYLPEATLAGRAGLHLESALRGKPVEAVRDDALAYLCDASPSAVPVNRALRHMLKKVLAGWPPDQRLRVLEVNGGALGLVAELAAELPSERCDYIYAAGDENVAARARVELEHLRQVETRTLDLSRDPIEQGLPLHGFDLVIASHCLHDAPHVDRTLTSLRRLLSADGVLVTLERSPERAIDLVFGLDPEWWVESADGGPPASRVREPEQWLPALERAGFEESLVLSEPAPDVSGSWYVLLARNPQAGEIETDVSEQLPRVSLILSDADGPSAELAHALGDVVHDAGHRPVQVVAGSLTERLGEDTYAVANTREGYGALAQLLRDDAVVVADVIHLLGLEPEPEANAFSPTESVAAPLAIADARCTAAMYLAQSFGDAGTQGPPPPQLWLVTAGAAPLDGAQGVPDIGARAPGQAPLWGFGRVLMNEYAELATRLIDLPLEFDTGRAARLLADEFSAAAHGSGENEIVLGADTRHVMRLDRQPAAPEPPDKADCADTDDVCVLDFTSPGPLSNLAWRHEAARAPGVGEIQIEVRATGLNFRDVMYAMGMLSDEAVENGFAGASLGLECAGVVVDVGRDVTGFKIGESVIAFARACFGTLVTTPTTAVAHKPAGWSFEAAATVPSAFFTVFYALDHLAQLGPRERVLIHGAAGGVGMAAIQYARHRGAEVFATAGSHEKRDFLRLLGVDHVLDSRSLDFADTIMTLTDGEGVDVVLNSLSGEAMVKSLSVVRPFGRFLELGKRDFYENSKLGLRPFRNNISYFGIDADQLLVERPDLAGRIFREMMKLFEELAFRPLVHHSFPAPRAADAFRHMQQSRHIGKIVVGYDESPAKPIPARGVAVPSTLELERNATYLVTGGLGGFGLRTAEWLVEKGARNLALIGRRGLETPGAAEALAALGERGVNVEAIAADVSDARSLAAALKRIDGALPPLRGVVHAAMVLEDGLVRNLDEARLAKVLAPKAHGAWNLHVLTRERALDFFVMYSSATTAFGNPGQSAYVAANLYLEGLALKRRAEGLPAISVGWGPIGDAGYLSGNQEVREGLSARIGGGPLEAAEALRTLEQLILTDTNGVAVVDLDWRILSRTMPGVRTAKFGAFVGRGTDDERDAGGLDVRELLGKMSEDEARDAMIGLIAEQVGKVLRMPAEKLDAELSIYDLGMDSLMAVELHMALEERFGVSVPIMAVTEGATLRQLATRLAAQITSGGAENADPGRDKVASLAARHGEELSEDEVGTLIEEASKTQQSARLIS